MHQFYQEFNKLEVSNAVAQCIPYKHLFGMVILTIKLKQIMTQYTGGSVYNRRAILTMNLQGGGGLEIWQYLDRQESQAIETGDLGNSVILKSINLETSHQRLKSIKDISYC
jgi:hypothetical protein